MRLSLLGLGLLAMSPLVVFADEVPDVPASLTSDPAEQAEPAAPSDPATPSEPVVLPAAPIGTDEAIRLLEAKLAQQQAAIDELNTQLTRTRLKLLDVPDLTFKIEGDYRARGYAFNKLFASQTAADGSYRDARYMRHRLRLRPVMAYKELAKLTMEVRGLDGVVWGDNQSLSAAAVLAQDPSYTGIDGTEVPLAEISRAWIETKLPIGVLRVGRQPTHWGMGILANDGNGFPNSFGESNAGNQNDRVLFATNPAALIQAATGGKGKPAPLVAAVAVDRLVEAPLYKYYGFECSPGITSDSPRYDPRCDLSGNGVTDASHSWDDKSRTPEQRGADWWADQNDDVLEMVYVLAYRGEDVRYLGGQGEFIAGTYVITRNQKETDSNAVIIDGHLRARVHGIYVEGEAVWIGGRTKAITLPDFSNPEDPLAKKADVFGYVARAGYEQSNWRLVMETGYASGDANPNDERFQVRALNQDYNVGLLLYEEILANVTRALWTDTARGLWSNGGVYNSRYIFPTFTYEPLDNWQVIGGFLMAWPDKADGAFIRCRSSDKLGCDAPPASQATSDTLGWEIDVAVKHTFHKHLMFSVEAGWARTTDRIPLAAAGLDPSGKFFTLQSRFGWLF